MNGPQLRLPFRAPARGCEVDSGWTGALGVTTPRTIKRMRLPRLVHGEPDDPPDAARGSD